MVCACMLSHFSRVLRCAILWTAAQKDPLSMGFSRQENWNGLVCPSPGDLPDPGIKPTCLMFPALAGGFFTTRVSWQVQWYRLTDFQGRNREEDVKKRLVDMGGLGEGKERVGWIERAALTYVLCHVDKPWRHQAKWKQIPSMWNVQNRDRDREVSGGLGLTRLGEMGNNFWWAQDLWFLGRGWISKRFKIDCRASCTTP